MEEEETLVVCFREGIPGARDGFAQYELHSSSNAMSFLAGALLFLVSVPCKFFREGKT